MLRLYNLYALSNDSTQWLLFGSYANVGLADVRSAELRAQGIDTVVTPSDGPSADFLAYNSGFLPYSVRPLSTVA